MVQRIVIGLCLLVAAPAFAQSTYVTGAVGADVFRTAHFEGRGIADQNADGEALAFSLAVGTGVTDRWGVELGFTRPSEITRDLSPYPIPLGAALPGSSTALPGNVGVPAFVLSTFQSTARLARRNTTLDAVAWARQMLNGRVDLVYSGGIAFTRVTETQSFDLSRLALPIYIPFPTETTAYSVGPVVGMQARITMTDHLMLVPDIRLHSIPTNGTGAWLLRPSIGLGWRF